jgi:hypothetical protein
MIRFIIVILCLLITLRIIYNKFYGYKKLKGNWIKIDRNIKILNNLEWDVSANSDIYIPNFNYLKNYIFSHELTQKLKENESFLMSFFRKDNSYSSLDVYDKNYNLVHNIVDPDAVLFSTLDNENHYKLEKDKEYYFFLRFNHSGEKMRYQLYKLKGKDYLPDFIQIENTQTNAVDEEELYDLFVETCDLIRESMDERGYYLTDIKKSEEYISYPSSNVSNKLEVFCEVDDIMILVCTNKNKNFDMKFHSIEINSQNNNLNWFPEDNNHISHLILNNEDIDDNYTFYERTNKVSHNSKLIPFRVLVFRGMEED